MNRWKIEFFMKNGCGYTGMYEGPETDSNSVFRKLIEGQHENCFVGIFGSDKKNSNMLVKIGEIEAIEISEWV